MPRRPDQLDTRQFGSLGALIAPITPEQFFAEYFSQRPLHVSGSAGRFAKLIDWPDLERVLEFHPADPARLRVIKRDKDVEPDRYTRRSSGYARIDGGAMSLLLDSGATLIINHIDEFVPGIADIADIIGDELHATTQVNLYATCRDAFGFGPHWDSHDVIVIQVDGRKSWSLYQPNRTDPLRDDPNIKPDDKLTLDREVTLESGDVLYLPRGWIHAPVPAGKASLHLTVSINRPSGTGFLKWLAEELQSDPAIRAAIPTATGAEPLDAWKARVAEIVGQAIAGAAAERYLASKDAKRGARPRISFGDFGRVPPSAWTDSSLLRPASSHRFIHSIAEDGSAHIEALGQTWPCSPAVAEAIGRLRSTRHLTLGDLRAGLSDKDASDLRQLLNLLTTMGLLSASNR